MQQARSPNESWLKTLRFAGCLAIVGGVWLLVLPAVGRLADIRVYIDRNEQLGIDPSAKFYTELPLMPRIYDRVEGITRRQEDSFWQVSAAPQIAK